MKNILNYKFALSCLALLGLASCADDDQDYPAANKPVVSSNVSNMTLSEGESATFTISLSKPISVTTDIKIEPVSGNISNDVDYTFDVAHLDEFELGPEGYQATMPIAATTLEVTVTALEDIYPEGSETTTFRLIQGQAGNATVPNNLTFDLTVNNTESDDFTMILEWDGEFVGADGESHSFCDMDLDYELYDGTGSTLIGTSYSSCPEQITIPFGALPDGDYLMVPSFYSVTFDAGSLPESRTAIPAKLTFAKPGVWLEEIDVSSQWNTADGGLVEGSADAYLVRFLLTISDSGTVYTVTDLENGEIIGQGRSAASKVTLESINTELLGGRN